MLGFLASTEFFFIITILSTKVVPVDLFCFVWAPHAWVGASVGAGVTIVSSTHQLHTAACYGSIIDIAPVQLTIASRSTLVP